MPQRITFMNCARMIGKMLTGFAILVVSQVSLAQCPQVYDFYGMTPDTPYWYSCTGNNYSFNLQSPNNWGAYTIDWGDGTPITSGATWNSPLAINHVYTSVVDTFAVTITETLTGCVVQGVVIMEEATSASIQIPVGGLTQACAPQLMEFINSSTNVSETTTFTWDFGDGSPQLTFDYTNWNQMISHIYEVGTVDCETEVTLYAENYCNIVQGGASEATFNPIRIWDLDDAAISASNTLLCYPDTTVIFTNTTERNCLFQGNIYQRYEYWNFGDYWGAGQDSIIDWTPWPPTFPHTLHYPGIGSYTVQLLDSNFCGIDTTSITIQIVPPPIAGIGASNDTICVGQSITFYQQGTGSPNSYTWNFGNGFGWIPTGSGNITFVYNTPGTFTVQNAVAIAGSSSSCSDTASVTIVVLPNPLVQIIPDITEGCDELAVNYTQNSINAISWNWIFDASPFTFNGPNPPPIFYNGIGAHNVTLNVVAANGCPGSDTEVVLVYQSPIANFSVDNLCEGEIAQFIDESTFLASDPIIYYDWDFGDGLGSNNSNPTHSYNGTGIYTIELAVSTLHCADTITGDVMVEPAPIPDINLDISSGCSPLSVHFTNETEFAAGFVWTFGDGNSSSLLEPSHVFTNNTLYDTTYVVIMTATNAFGCSASDTLYVTVFASANAAFDDNNAAPGCSPIAAYFTNLSTGATSYLWNFGDNTTSTQVSPSHLYNNTTGFVANYLVSLYAYNPNGCNDTTTQILVIYPLADFGFDISPDSGCAPLLVNMPFISGAQSFNWNFGDGSFSTLPNPTHQFSNDTNEPITYTVTLVATSPFGCTDTAVSFVIVNPSPVAQFLPDIFQGCSPLTVNFQNLSLEGDIFSWDYGDNSASQNTDEFHSHTFVNLTGSIQAFDVELITETLDGCSDSFVANISVYPQVIASFQIPGESCSPAIISLNNNSSNGTYFDWDFGNGLQSQDFNPTTSYINNSSEPQSFVIQLNVLSNNGCVDYFSDTITINPSPEAIFTSNQNSACEPAPLFLTNNSIGASSYSWSYGDGTSSNIADQTHIHIFQAPGNNEEAFTILLTATSAEGCTDQQSTQFTLFPEVVADFEVNAVGCSPMQASFVNQSIDAIGYQWDFGNGQFSSAINPTVTYTTDFENDTSFIASLISTNAYGCTDTVYAPIEVYHTPVASAFIDSLAGCYPLEVTFQNASIGADSYLWVYGTGQTSTTSEEFHMFTFFNPGNQIVTYQITLNAYTNNGCTSSVPLSVNVSPVIEADFQVINEGCTPLTLTFDNNSSSALSYSWDFGDGDYSNQFEPTHTYFNWGTNDTTYTVTLTIQNGAGCTDNEDFTITVFLTPIVSFDANPDLQMWPAATITLDNTTIGGSLNYEWNMNDGTELYAAEPGTYTYSTWGEYTIQLIGTNGYCSDTAYQTIDILPPPPIADFTGPASGCVPLTVQFDNLSQNALSSFWSFGDGGQANATNPIYTYWQPGTYTVTLEVSGYDGSVDVMIQEYIIEVYPSALAIFTVTPNEVNVPGQPVYCLNLSQNANQYEWNFGDGNTSNETNPIHYFGYEGIYSVTLIANNEYNCPDTMTVVDAVYATAVGLLDYPNAFTPNTTSPGNGSYDAFGYDNDAFFPMHRGVLEYRLQIFNKWGELLFESKNVNIGWNGYYRDQLCRQDVYVWKAQARFVDGQEIIKSGDVTLLVK